jgi:hypothetical protein
LQIAIRGSFFERARVADRRARFGEPTTEDLLRSNGATTVAVPIKLVRAGLATTETEGVRGSGGGKRLVEIRRVRITKAGRRELQNDEVRRVAANIARLPTLLRRAE